MLFASLLLSHNSLGFFGVCNLADYVSGRFCDKTLFDLPSKTCLEEATELTELTEQVPVSFPFQMLYKDFIIILRLSRGS